MTHRVGALFALGLGVSLWVMNGEGAVANRRIDNIAAQIHETEAGLREALADGLGGAAGVWLPLIRWNDPVAVKQACVHCAAPDRSGRMACGVRLWSEPPKPTAPKAAAR